MRRNRPHNGDGMIPCGGCQRGAPYDGLYRVADQCRLCWLYANDASYKALWDGLPVPSPPKEPSLAKKVLSWAAEMAKWVAAGRPAVSRKEKERRHAICQSNQCGAYDRERDTCLACGCPLHKTAFGEKLSMATSACPKGLW